MLEATVLYELMKHLRRIISTEKTYLIDLVFNLKLGENLTLLLDIPNDDLRFEVAWIITNILAHKSEYCVFLVSLGVHHKLIELLSTKHSGLKEQVT